MPKITVKNYDGNKVEEIVLSDFVFGLDPHQQAMYEVVRAQRAAMRQGNASTKDRSEVRGGGKKPWRQKGTGRARHGSSRSPIWRSGGVTFGPKPRKYNVKINKKVKHLALRSALSSHVKNNTLHVFDRFDLENHKTKVFYDVLKKNSLEGKSLLLLDDISEKLALSTRNIRNIQLSSVDHASTYDILKTKNLIVDKSALTKLEESLRNE